MRFRLKYVRNNDYFVMYEQEDTFDMIIETIKKFVQDGKIVELYVWREVNG